MEQEKPHGPGMVQAGPDVGGITLLYVEDETDARSMVSKMLLMNYPDLTLFGAENGAVGLELYQAHLPDIVMTDINMPVMDGIRMSREIKAVTPEAVIIAVTAHSDTSYLLNAIEIGIQHYVLKPINYQELFRVIDKILEQIQLKRLVEEQNRRIIEREQQLAGAQQIAHLGSWQWDLQDGAMSWSDELYRICGLEPGAVPAAFPSLLERIHPEDREAVLAALQQAREKQRPLAAHFCRIVRADASIRILRIDAEVSLGGAGRPLSMIGTAHDVTELKRAEEQVRSLTEELERRVIQRTSLLQTSIKELESFSYAVSHDLRAPVARLEGFCRALLEDCGNCPNTQCRSYAERAERVVRQVKGIIDAFNELSHYARCTLKLQEVDLSQLARTIAAAFQASEPERAVDFVIAERLPVQGDARLLQTALEHLLGNAWKFTSKKERARIELGCRQQEGHPVYFVRDNGVGFNMKYVDKLFQPFQTVHSPGEFAWNGTAVGLATVHSIILRHGGRIWAEAEVDRGATFFFTLEEHPEPGHFLKSRQQGAV